MKPSEAAEAMRKLADKIEQTEDGEFGGAFMIVPPGQDDLKVDSLIVSSAGDPESFFLVLKTRLDVAMDAISKKQMTYGRR